MTSISILICLLISTSCHSVPPGFRVVKIESADSKPLVSINAELADTNEERMKGLMFRDKLGAKEGMLFIFDGTTESPFWMKNTPLPLDMLFINGARQVVDVFENATPYSEAEIWPKASYLYVIEVNAGFVKKYHLEKGDRIIF